MEKKFYQSKQFVKLQNKWYKKLKQSGFQDLEWYNPDSGFGQGSPFLQTKGNITLGDVRRKYRETAAQYFRLSRNFLQCACFYLILKENFNNSEQLRREFSSLRKYLSTLPHYYSKAESILWSMHCDGSTIRKISAELRRLYKYKKLGNPAKRKSKRPFVDRDWES